MISNILYILYRVQGVTMIFWAKLSNGELRKIKALNRKDATKQAKSSGYRVHKITKDGGYVFNVKGQPK
jgi:hypothetical protein